jgi:hypothetical protein
MDEATIRKYAEAHGENIVKGDMQAGMADIDPSVMASLAGLASEMPNPATSAEVKSIDAGGEEAIVQITYSGADKTATVQSRWKDNGQRPVIVAAEIV